MTCGTTIVPSCCYRGATRKNGSRRYWRSTTPVGSTATRNSRLIVALTILLAFLFPQAADKLRMQPSELLISKRRR